MKPDADPYANYETKDGEDDDSDILDDADGDDDDVGDSDLDVALRRLELCRQEIVSLRKRVATLEQRQRARSSKRTSHVGRAPTTQQVRREGTIR